MPANGHRRASRCDEKDARATTQRRPPRCRSEPADGVARGELDPAIPLPLMHVAFVALGVLPQVASRALETCLGISLLLKEVLADASMEMFFRAAGRKVVQRPGSGP